MDIAAPRNVDKYVPEFTVKKLEGKRNQEILSFTDTGKLIKKVTEVDAGWMVYFPAKKHSLRITTKDELERLGFDQTIKLVDNDGEVGAQIPNPLAVVK